jgi:L-asparaginase II
MEATMQMREKDQYDIWLDQALTLAMVRPSLAHEYAKMAATYAMGARDIERFNRAIHVAQTVLG